MHRRIIRTIAASAALAFALTACGQKPGVHVENGVGDPLAQAPVADQAPSDGGQATAAPADSAIDTGGVAADPGTTGDGNGADAATTTSPGATGGTDPNGGGSTPSQNDPGSGGTQQDPGGDGDPQQPSGNDPAPTDEQRPVTGDDRTGVTDDKITIATHAPVTGAAPLPTTSFEKSSDLYWRAKFDQGGTVLGRTEVELLFRDDKYDPNSARQVCRELAQKAFTLTGGGGTDQIQACGQFAGVAEVPYFSAGVTEAGLRENPWYFAASMSYKQQGPLLAQMVKKFFPGKKVAAIVTDTPNFDDAVEGWETGVQQSGLDYTRTLRHPKGDTSWYNAFASELQSSGVEVIYILSSPVDYIRFAQQASQGGYHPQYVGVGISMGLNAVLGSGCAEPGTQVDEGMFFSPFPGLDYGRANVPEFFEAGEKYNAPTDDIALGLWGTNAVFDQLLSRYGQIYGNDLTREDFRDMVEQQTDIKTKVFPTLSYSPQNHFGSQSAHLLKANCSIGEYETVASFVNAF
jgi:ABC-type branched-subunit amino acid transport system substrate-binding protein